MLTTITCGRSAGRTLSGALPALGVLATLLLALLPTEARSAPADPSWTGQPIGPAGSFGPRQSATWLRIPLEGATCGGPPPRQTYEYFLNPAQGTADGILIVLSGGGACVKEGPPPPGATGAAVQLHCMSYGNFADPFFNATTFASDLAPSLAIPVFRRSDATNPLRNYHFVAVPYCTGDLHAGTMTAPHDYDPDPQGVFEVLHRGHLNLEAVLADLTERVPLDLPVVLTGFSAGGFGAIYNFPTVVALWPRTTLIPDSGIAPAVSGSLLDVEGEGIARRWGATDLLPPYCRDRECLADTLHLLTAHAAQHDGRSGRDWLPFGLLQGQQDATLADYLQVSQCTYELGLGRSLTGALALDNVRAFVPATDKHVFGAVNPLGPPFVSQGGVDPIRWFAQLAVADEPGDLPASALDPWLPCNPLFLASADR